MKFNLTITDMNEEEFAKLFATINVPCAAESSVESEESVVQPIEDPIVADKDGLPWDARIHSSNHKINSDGRWQRRRGVSDVEFNAVKNELLGVQEPVTEVAPNTVAVTTGTVTPVAPDTVVVPPVVAPAPVAPMSPELAAVNHTLYTPAPVAPVVAPVAEPTPVADSAMLYQTMFEKIKVGMSKGVVKANDIQNMLVKINKQFGTTYESLYLIKDSIPALQFVIDDLTARGL